MTEFCQAIELVSGGRQLDLSRAAECVDLMKEFLRREALWAGRLGLTDEIPFADLSAKGSGTDYAGQYLVAITSFTYSVAESRSCVAMFNWYGRRTSASFGSGSPELPDPYPPLMELFRRGGTFTREHRVFIEVNMQHMVQADLIQSEVLRAMTLAALPRE